MFDYDVINDTRRNSPEMKRQRIRKNEQKKQRKKNSSKHTNYLQRLFEPALLCVLARF